MSKTPWTPGPWIVRDERSVGGDFLIVRPAPDGGLIDTLWMARPCLQGPETEANARLIAAAPEMAEVLADLRRLCSDIPAVERNPRFAEINQRVLALLARIRGDAT